MPEVFVPEWRIPSLKGQTIPSGENLFKGAFLVAALLASFYTTCRVANLIESAAPVSPFTAGLKWPFIAAMGVWDCVLLTGMGVLAHDAVHRVLFRTPFWNELFGGLLWAFPMVPFYANRQFHLVHHRHSHQPGLDPEEEMHRRPFLYAATIGSTLAMYLQYRNLFRSLLRSNEPQHAVRVAKDAFFLSVAVSFYVGLVPALGLSLMYTVVPMALVLFPVFAWRALSDHYGVPPAGSAAQQQGVLDTGPERLHHGRVRRHWEVSGWVVLTSPWLEWLWSHVNYHEVHHKYPWLSHAHLKRVFDATREREPYLVVQGYWRSLANIAHNQYYGTRERARSFLSTPEW